MTNIIGYGTPPADFSGMAFTPEVKGDTARIRVRLYTDGEVTDEVIFGPFPREDLEMNKAKIEKSLSTEH